MSGEARSQEPAAGVGMWEAGLREALGYITMSDKKRVRVSQGIGVQTA